MRVNDVCTVWKWLGRERRTVQKESVETGRTIQ